MSDQGNQNIVKLDIAIGKLLDIVNNDIDKQVAPGSTKMSGTTEEIARLASIKKIFWDTQS